MPQFRVTMFFKSGIDGWSETYFATTQQGIGTARSQASDLALLRGRLVTLPAEMTYVRVSDDLKLRDSLVISPPPIPGGTIPGGADAPFTALQLRIEASDLLRRPLFMRGIPDSIVTEGGGYAPTARWQAPFDDYTAELKSGRWGIKSIDPTLAELAITELTLNPADLRFGLFTTGAPHGFLVGDQLTVRKAQRSSKLNGIWRVSSVVDATHYNAYKLKPVPNLIYLAGATVQRRTFRVSTMTDVIVRGITHRVQGRPFGQHRGKSRARIAS